MADLIGTSGTDNLNGGSGDDAIYGGDGNDKINGGAGDDVLNGGSGSDTLNGGSGDDTLVYNVSENDASGTKDVYTGGSGLDTVLIEFTLAQWLDPVNQAQVQSYLQHLATYTNAKTGQMSNGLASDFKFIFGNSTLTVQMIEKLGITVDGEPINPVDEAVTATADAATMDEDAPSVTIGVLSNDMVPDLVADLQVESQPAGGTAQVLTNGSSNPADWTIEYTALTGQWNHLAQGETAQETFSYRVIDANGDSQTASVTITITGTNDGPTAVADVASTDEDHSVTFSVLGNDTDPDATDELTVTGATITNGAAGSVTVEADGQLTFNPGSAYNSLAVGESATVEITYDISDGHGGTASALATVTVTGTNDGPAAVADVASADEDDSVTFSVLANDSDPDSSDVLTVTGAAITNGAPGSVTVEANGQLTFNPGSAYNHLAVGESAAVEITYDISDGHGGTASALATVTVTGTNDGPTAVADVASADEDDSVTFSVLANDSDPDTSDVLTVTGATITNGAAGSVTVEANGQLTFNPGSAYNSLAVGESATVEITYDISDGHGGTASALATVTVTGTNDGPTAVADVASAAEDDSVTFSVLGNDSDPDTSDVLTVTGATITNGAAGSVTVEANGQLTFDPGSAYNHLAVGESATVEITYDISDGNGGTHSAVATVTVTGTNDGPTAVADVASTDEDNSVTFSVLGNDSDPDPSDVLTVTGAAITNGAAGSVTVEADGQLTFDPGSAYNSLALGEIRVVEITYGISDGNGGTASAVATVTVTGTNDGPTITSNGGGPTAAVGVAENTTAVTTVTASDVDSGAVLTYSIAGGADAGRFSIDSATGVLSFVDSPDFENPLDVGGDNVYDVVVGVSDGIDLATQSLAVTVADVSEGVAATDLQLVVTMVPTGNNLPSGAFARFDVVDPDGGAAHTFSLGGASSSAFTLHATTGVLTAGTLSDNQIYVLDVTVAQAGEGTYTETFRIHTGSNGSDTLIAANTDDAYFGRNQTDIITAGDGDDTVVGQQGNDLIGGGNGSDDLWGGQGNDTFVFHAGETGVDTIGDFNANGDLISLVGFGNIGTPGTLAATDFHSAANAGTATVGLGVNVIFDSSTGTLYYDSDGGNAANRTALVNIVFDGNATFNHNDIVVGS